MNNLIIDFIHQILIFIGKLLFLALLLYAFIIKPFSNTQTNILDNAYTKNILYGLITNPLTLYNVAFLKSNHKKPTLGRFEDSNLFLDYAIVACNQKCSEDLFTKIKMLRQYNSDNMAKLQK